MTSRKNILETINKYSLELYLLLKSRKIKINNLYEAILTGNKSLILKNILPVSDKKIEKLKKDYIKLDCLDEILYLTGKKYRHLKDIRYIVNIDFIVEKIITEKIYDEKIKIHYTDLIVDILVEKFYDYKDLKIFSKLKQQIIEMDSNINMKIIKNIDQYYIKKITV